MTRVPIVEAGFRCERCFHQWAPRDENQEPRTCPGCKSPYWNRPRKDLGRQPSPGNEKRAQAAEIDRLRIQISLELMPMASTVPAQPSQPPDQESRVARQLREEWKRWGADTDDAYEALGQLQSIARRLRI